MPKKVRITVRASLTEDGNLDWYLRDDGTEMSLEEIREWADENALEFLANNDDSYWDVDVEIRDGTV